MEFISISRRVLHFNSHIDGFEKSIVSFKAAVVAMEKRICSLYSKKSVLVTGATGFVGKVLVEKLLRDVSSVEKVYILIRAKRKKSVEERFVQLKSSQVFRRIHLECPEAFTKLIPIEADITDSKSFGISEENLEKLKNEVSFVFHLAATVKFDDSLDVAIQTNLIATKMLVEISQKFKHLEAFVYVSTAFSNVHIKIINEVIHESDFSWREAIQAVDSLDKEKLKKLLERSQKHFPNTYTYSKHLAEKFINEKSSEIPAIILRPSIVIPNVKDPFPGWIDFRGTCMGLQIGIFLGVMKSFYGKSDTILSLVPCDFVTNAAIVSAIKMAQDKIKSLKIYNCTPKSGKRTVGELKDIFLMNSREICPSEKVMFYPNTEVYSSFFSYMVMFFLFQFLPALIYDLLMWPTRKEFKFLEINKKIFKSITELEFFTMNQTEFDDSECVKLSQLLHHGDR